jgi:hypothetical protein
MSPKGGSGGLFPASLCFPIREHENHIALARQAKRRRIQPMNKIAWKEQLTPIETDYARWCAEQGALLRSGRLDSVDRENLAEEIESLGRSERREVESRMAGGDRSLKHGGNCIAFWRRARV